jgi:hypothetical protein
MKGANDNLVGCIQRHLHLAAIGIDDKILMLRKRCRSEQASEGEGCEELHCVSPWGNDY